MKIMRILALTGAIMAALRAEWYEGNLEPNGPSAAQCTSLGVSGTNCAASIAAAIAAWKASSSAYATQLRFYNLFMGTDPTYAPTFGVFTHSKTPSQLVSRANCNGSDTGWAPLLLGCLPNSGLTQIGLAVQNFNAQ